jgi:hypothetical protein
MGRQIQVAMTEPDEEEFVGFLRSTAAIQILESSAPVPSSMMVERFAPARDGHWQYFVWNTAFAWVPEYGQVSPQAVESGRAGWAYVRNSSMAPVLEYDRHNFTSPRGVTGRIYWAKTFAATGPLPYDVEAFSKWFDQVVRWIRKNGRRAERGAYERYFLPDAWRTYHETPNWPTASRS